MDDNNEIRQYKPAKTVKQQIDYLETNKRVVFNEISKKEAEEILLKYNYINVITPYKYKFAKRYKDTEIRDCFGNHIYERNVEFKEYYDLYLDERKKYPVIAANILNFETQFKAISNNLILTKNDLSSSDKLIDFLDNLSVQITINAFYSKERLDRMNSSIEKLKVSIDDYADIYCFFDHLSLGVLLTVFCGLVPAQQKDILKELKARGLNFGVDNINNFIDKVFTLVAVRNTVMHCNSLEILVRFYNPRTKTLRTPNNRRKYNSLIKLLSKEKTYIE